MKKLLLICSILLLGSQLFNAQTLLLQESFETDGEGTRYTSNSFSTGTDYFIRTQNGGSEAINNAITNIDGSFFWAGEDCDSASGGTGILTFNPISFSGYDRLVFDILLATTRPGDGRWEPSDEFLIQYNIDNGGWNTFAAFYGTNDGILPNTDPAYGSPVQDADLDGFYDPALIDIDSSNLTNWNFNANISGNSLQIRFIMGQNAGTEELIVDNIRISGDTTLGIDDNNVLFNNVLIYPNPNNGLINIDLADLKNPNIKIYNTLGQLIYRKENITNSFHQLELNESKGLYFIEISSQNSKQTYKLIMK